MERALHSASDSLTLVAQQAMKPYKKVRGAGIKFRDMHLHMLPWPVAALRDLFDTEVELRITLCYFVEPSPGERGYAGPFTYASHGFRFALQNENESDENFRLRVNVGARDEEDDGNYIGDAAGWLLGPNNRNKGSLHHDRWTGSAAKLAARRHLAVYPIAGWWRSRPHLERAEKEARYSLIVSLHAPQIPIDLYAEIEHQMVPVPVVITTG